MILAEEVASLQVQREFVSFDQVFLRLLQTTLDILSDPNSAGHSQSRIALSNEADTQLLS